MLQDKLGTYVLCEGELVNDRTCYAQHGNPARMIWFLTPYWYVGKREEKGLGQGWLQARMDEYSLWMHQCSPWLHSLWLY